MEQITLDLIPKGSLPVLHASQYDDGRQWMVNLKENGEDYTLTNETIVLGVRKGDGCAVTCAVAIESGKNYVILTSTEQMCAVAGQNLAELQITKDNMKIGTLNFILQVERDPLNGSISSASEIHDLQHQVDECVGSALADLGASGLPYDNTESGLTADNVQQAIDEVNEKASGIASELDDKADKSSTYTKTEVDTLIRNLPDPMVFKGTLGVGGTIETLPTASASNEGWTFKCITAGTYAGLTLKVGDTVTCFNPPNTSNYYWDKTGSQDTDTDTWRAIKVNGVEKLGNGISSGSVDFVDTTNVKFAFDSNGNAVKATLNGIDTSSEVDAKVAGLIDDTSKASNKTWSSDKISAELASLLPVDEVSGAVANFDTDVVLPLIDVKAAIVATGGGGTPQAPIPIVGVDKVNVTRCGKNLFDKSKMVISTQRFVKYGVDAYNDNLPNGEFTLKANQAYTFTFSGENSTNFESFSVYNEEGTRVAVVYNNKKSTFTPTSTGAYYLAFAVSSGNWGGTWDNYDIQLEVGSTATDYEPYNGTTALINLGGTYYGGELDIINGKLKITHAIKKFSELTWGSSTWGSSTAYSASLSDAKSNSTSTLAGLVCEMYNEITAGSMYSSNNDAICLNGTILRLRDNNFATFEAWKEATKNCEVVYPLATPIEVDLTPQAITALVGVNNLWSDTNGDTTVKYKLGIQAYIDKKIAEVQALVL